MMVYVWLILGFVLLIYGGDMLVCGSVKLAKKVGVSPLLIGLTLVGFGTSTPELVTSLLAAYKGSAGISVGNVVGSNIANILLVLGVAAVISPVKVDVKAFKRDGTFLAVSTVGVLLALVIGKINMAMGAVLVATLIVYVVYSYVTDKKSQTNWFSFIKTIAGIFIKTIIGIYLIIRLLRPLVIGKIDMIMDSGLIETIMVSVLVATLIVYVVYSYISETDSENGWISLVKTVVGIALTIYGAKLLVDNAIILAERWHIPQAVIGLTIVAVGTSLPELITSIMSSIRGHNDVAFGNVVGSNIYNALFILGVTALLIDISVPKLMFIDALIMTVVTVLLMAIAFWKKQFSRPVGAFFLILYAIYVWMLFA